MEKLSSLGVAMEPTERDNRLGMVLNPLHPCRCWSLPAYSVLGMFGFFQPVLSSKQLQQTLLPFPAELAAVAFFVMALMPLQCALVLSFNLLSQAAEGGKDADRDKGISFFREERLLLVSLLCRESKQEDVLWGHGGEVGKGNFSLLFAVASSVCWGKGAGQAREKLFPISRNFHVQTRRKRSPCQSAFFWTRYALRVESVLRSSNIQ